MSAEKWDAEHAAGRRIPPNYLDGRDLEPHLIWFMDSFFRLNADRGFHMGGASRIRFTAIDAYARRYGIVGDEFDRFLALIGALDSEYLAKSKPDNGSGAEVSMTDVDGVRNLLKRQGKPEDE